LDKPERSPTGSRKRGAVYHVLALILLVIATAAAAQAARVVDGDTLELVDAKRIRLWGIDAPEGAQTCQRAGRPWRCGDEATAALLALVNGRELTCVERDIDQYGRIVATCTVNGEDIGAAMVRQGWALDFERYSNGAYAAEQLEAEQAQRGLWSGSFVAPWEWRAAR
jgi:endonuclease YncB( thermonuclease family)